MKYDPILAEDCAYAINYIGEAMDVLAQWEGLDELGLTEAETWRTMSIEYSRIVITHIRKVMHSSGMPWEMVLEKTGGKR